jgi:hypothetical protein
LASTEKLKGTCLSVGRSQCARRFGDGKIVQSDERRVLDDRWVSTEETREEVVLGRRHDAKPLWEQFVYYSIKSGVPLYPWHHYIVQLSPDPFVA